MTHFSVWQGILSAVFHCCAGQVSSPPTDQLTKVDLERFIFALDEIQDLFEQKVKYPDTC